MVDWITFEAVLFDLDGVLTATAQVHARCWKRMFDDYLSGTAGQNVGAARLFELPDDYARLVDGKPRYDGVRSFLSSRGLWLPDGTPADPPSRETVCGLGNRKSALFNTVLQADGVETYADALDLVRHLKRHGVRQAVVSSSRNCGPILETAGIADLFELRVDGVVAERLGLAGKPAPDTFLHAARELGVAPASTAVVEDAIAGVRAGQAGAFGLVVGIDRTDGEIDLRAAGAGVVVTDLRDTLPVNAAAEAESALAESPTLTTE